MHNASVVIITPDTDLKGCHFTLQSHTIGANMSQRINLKNKWDSTHWSYSYAILYGRMSSEVSIYLNGLNKNGEILNEEVFGK